MNLLELCPNCGMVVPYIQVWRQIGVLYQSASQSQELLQRVEQQTAQHVGGSLQALSSMDKRVGQVWKCLWRYCE